MSEHLVQTGRDINSIMEKLQYGDIVRVEPGEYGGVGLTKMGITFISIEPRGAKTGQWFFESGANENQIIEFEVTTGNQGGAFILNRANKNNLIKSCHMYECGSIGVDITGGSNLNKILGCLIHDCHYAFHTSGGGCVGNIFQRNHCYNHSDGINVSPSALGTKILENIIHDCIDDGIHVFDDGQAEIIGNLVYNCKGWVLIVSGSGKKLVRQNTIIGTPGATKNIVVYLEGSNFEVKSNIVYANDPALKLLYPYSGFGIFDYNAWYNPQNPLNRLEYKDKIGLHSILQDPKFMDIINHDYRLGPDSPCIGAGEDGKNMGTYILNGGGQPMEQWNIVVNVEATEKGGSITTIVKKKSDGSPLSGASVSITGLGTDVSGATDANGEHKVEGLPRGDYKVACAHPGYDLNPPEVMVSIPILI